MSLADNFRRYLIHGEPVSPLPRMEIMPYHPATLQRWRAEGLPLSVQTQAQLHDYFGLDPLEFFFLLWPDLDGVGCRQKIRSADDFRAARGGLYDLEKVRRHMASYRRELESVQKRNGVMWIPLHGFFWHPRDLFGVAEHMMAFYDQPALMHEICKELLAFNVATVRMLYATGVPAIICVSEDMAYKSGAMISQAMFQRFIAPYHRELLAEIVRQPCVAAIDSDGDISQVTGWFAELGYHCINPLERQTGMDLAALRNRCPGMAFMGGYNKRCMSQGSPAINAEFESLKPLFRQGKFIPAVDHQTPCEVSLENYRHYLHASETFFTEMGVAS